MEFENIGIGTSNQRVVSFATDQDVLSGNRENAISHGGTDKNIVTRGIVNLNLTRKEIGHAPCRTINESVRRNPTAVFHVFRVEVVNVDLIAAIIDAQREPAGNHFDLVRRDARAKLDDPIAGRVLDMNHPRAGIEHISVLTTRTTNQDAVGPGDERVRIPRHSRPGLITSRSVDDDTGALEILRKFLNGFTVELDIEGEVGIRICTPVEQPDRVGRPHQCQEQIRAVLLDHNF